MDIATLGIRVDAGGAVAELDRLGGSLTKTARHTDTLTGNARKQEENLRSLARQVATSGGELDRYAQRIIRLNGGLEAFKRIQSTVNDEMARGVTRTTALATSTERLSRSKSNAGLSAVKLQGSLRSLATSMIGLNSQVAGLANVLGTFAVGSGVMVGILAGLAALGFIYNRLTSDARAAKKANEELTASLASQTRASRAATEEGAKRVVENQKAALAAAKLRQSQSLFVQGGGLGAAAAVVERVRVSPASLAASVKEAQDAKIQAERDLEDVQIQRVKNGLAAEIASHELDQSFAADRKRWADEDNRRADEADAKRKKAHADEVRRFNERLALAKALAGLASESLAAASSKIGTGLDNFFNPAANPLTQTYQTAVPDDWTDMFEQVEKARKDAKEKIKKDAEDAAEQQKKIVENLIRSMQEGFSGFFVGIFNGGVGSFRKLFDQVKTLYFKMVADLLAAKLMEKLLQRAGGVFGGGVGKQQLMAGGIMLDASKNMLTAANIIAGKNTPPAGGNPAPAKSGGSQWLARAGAGVAGFGVGYGIGSMTTNRGVGALGGALGGAATGNAIAGPAGAIIGAATGLIGGFLGASKAAREAAKELTRLKEQFAVSMEVFRANVSGVGSGEIEAQARLKADTDALKLLARTVNPVDAFNRGGQSAAQQKKLDAILAEIEAGAKILADRLKADFAEARKRAREDLEVRALRGQGKTKEADALRFQLEQDRELAEAERSGMDAAYLARLKEVQAIERTAQALNTLTTSVRNAPSGFKVESYINSFAAASPFPPQGSGIPGGSIPYRPAGPLPKPGGGGTTILNFSQGSLDGAFVIDGNESPTEIARKVVAGLRVIAASSVGINVPLSQALDYA